VDPGDGLARVVSSGGNVVGVWKLQTSPTPTLTQGCTRGGYHRAEWRFLHQRVIEWQHQPNHLGVIAADFPAIRQHAAVCLQSRVGRETHGPTIQGRSRQLAQPGRGLEPGSHDCQRHGLCRQLQALEDFRIEADVEPESEVTDCERRPAVVTVVRPAPMVHSAFCTEGIPCTG